MQRPSQRLTEILAANPNVAAAYYDDPDNPTLIIIHLVDHSGAPNPGVYLKTVHTNLNLPQDLPHLPLQICRASPLVDLRTRDYSAVAGEQHQACQNEPIQCGCQIQPAGAKWVGTAGAPVKWLSKPDRMHWGILSNRHVLVPDDPRQGHAQHQPTDFAPACAFLHAWTPISSSATNYVDAAIADAEVEGKHTIGPDVLEVGPLAGQVQNAKVGLDVAKSGRTTGLTYATCTAIGASVRIGYGSFTALFADQDMYEVDSGVFSAPGDSGSMIFDAAQRRPTSLLFAGGGKLTIGNPMRFVAQTFGLVFPFP